MAKKARTILVLHMCVLQSVRSKSILCYQMNQMLLFFTINLANLLAGSQVVTLVFVDDNTGGCS